jgi:hypothetical protein
MQYITVTASQATMIGSGDSSNHHEQPSRSLQRVDGGVLNSSGWKISSLIAAAPTKNLIKSAIGDVPILGISSAHNQAKEGVMTRCTRRQ